MSCGECKYFDDYGYCSFHAEDTERFDYCSNFQSENED